MLFNTNLTNSPNFDSQPSATPCSSSGGATWKPYGWTASGTANVSPYGGRQNPPCSNFYLATTVPGPANRDVNFVDGGPADVNTKIEQTIDVNGAATAIDTGSVTVYLCGWFGGYAGVGDQANMLAIYQDQFGQPLAGNPQLLNPGISRSDRNDQSGLFFKGYKAAFRLGRDSFWCA